MSSFPTLILLFPFFLSIILYVVRASVPALATFRYVNEGELSGPYLAEYEAYYRVLSVSNSPFQLCLCSTALDNAFTLALRVGTNRSDSMFRWVWEANRGNPVGENATLTFGKDGDLVLADADGTVAWQTNTSNKGVVGFKLLPNGNMVIHGAKGNFIWQSFDCPTNTLLVGQSPPLQVPKSLRSKQKMTGPHVLAIPYPAQGHVIPLLELSQCLVMHGFRVTFVNTDYNHKRVVKALEEKSYIGDRIRLVSIPDGLEPWEDRNDFSKSLPALAQVMPGKLEELIKEINKVEAEKITCVIADLNLRWAIEIAVKMNIKRASFWTSSTTSLATLYYIPKLLEDGIIDDDGTPIKKQMIQLDLNMPSIFSEQLFWNCYSDLTTRKIIFEHTAENQKTIKLADFLICNSAYALEPAAFTSIPEALPIGPLLASNRLGHSAGYFWPEDSTCLKWLDQQPPQSVIYVAFGSFTVLDKIQFHELALGLELSNRPFLWVVRPDITDDANNAYPEGFEDRVNNRGRLVGWAPQQEVLSHPSIACFFSHCGWNSTLEGISNGVPFLCWPYFGDQFLDQSYICDIWKAGLRFDRNGSEIITREEIKNKVEQVLGNENFKAKALELKEIALNTVKEGGHSNKILSNFVEGLKA